MLELKKEIESGTLKSVYLFYGDERYLIDFYTAKLISSVLLPEDEMMNLSRFDYSAASAAVNDSDKLRAENISNACMIPPFMSEKRVCIVKESGFFQTGCAVSDNVKELISGLSDCVLVFVEEKVDKRSKLFKEIDKSGRCVNFEHQNENVLIKWVCREVSAENIQISQQTASFFISYIGNDMTELKTELNKIISCCMEKKVITEDDIRAACKPGAEGAVFTLTDCIASKNTVKGMCIYEELLSEGEAPDRLFFLIVRQFRLMLRVMLLNAGGRSVNEICGLLKMKSYPVEIMLRQGRSFGIAGLKEKLSLLFRLDCARKKGNIDINDACMIMVLGADY